MCRVTDDTDQQPAHHRPGGDWLVRGPSDAAEVAEHYDAWAESYDADLDAWSYRAPARVAGLLLEGRPQPGSVLDVGCGTGLSGRALRSAGYVGRLDGLDISEASLRVAQRTGAYDSLQRADLSAPLPAADDAYDAVVCVGVLTYLPDTEGVWREFARVVRPGGVVAMTQREDLWEPRGCQALLDRLASGGVWRVLELDGPAPYLPASDGELAELGAYYVALEVG